ncbi:signal transduction histidine kinase [Methylorubrum rhodinum]|uniref:histidine kinase n=1 Tax=Methylorubrum rhodinum TaxID=29428 RepID=A0A840ZNX6_9HYPH|nr:HAMP domain-containing sensor histidine kinase [Methylorubrum rhodinum]MBB5758758.1 signal transduction histidine kinase [Methylorubrum rhodinum]
MSARRPGGSLQRRLFLGALVFVTLALVVAGLAIGLVLYRFARGQIDARLDGELFAISADLRPGKHGPSLLAPHDGPPFDRPRSGWYWQVRAGDAVLRSPSLGSADLALPRMPEREEGRPVPADGTGPRGEGLILRVLRLPGPRDGPDAVLVAAAPAAALHGPLREAGKTLALALVLLGACLLAGIAVQVRLGLRPLRTLRDDLAAVRAGDRERVPAEQPQEIRPLVTELNLLLDQNAANLERARAHVANLAHGLKTPLATLAVAAERGAEPGLAPLVAAMDRQVRHHLRRARAAALGGPSRARADLSAQVSDLVTALARLHAERELSIETDVAAGLSAACDAQDVDEMLGNLIDNACRWARSRVRIRAERSGTFVELRVEDNGPGLTPDQAAHVLQRGRRLDESVPGDGFGLPITLELAELYGGTLNLERSDLGGLLARLRLPA